MNIALENYTGPLDLLLSIIEKQNENIYKVNVCSVIDQYITVIHQGDLDLDAMSSFLIVAARLLEIKAYMLLPPGEEEESADPAKELIEHLAEYKIYKTLAQKLNIMFDAASGTYVRQSSVEGLLNNKEFMYEKVHAALNHISLSDLEYIYSSLIEIKRKRKDPVEPKHLSMQKDTASFDEVRTEVKEFITERNQCRFSEIPDCNKNKERKIMTFLSILELSKQGEIAIEQDKKDISINRTLPSE